MSPRPSLFRLSKFVGHMSLKPIGYVYVLSNPMMPGLVKIGMTDRHNIQERVSELSSHAGVPAPFRIEYVAQVYHAYSIEQEVHRLLGETSGKSKEFFDCELLTAVVAIRKVAEKRLLDEDIKFQVNPDTFEGELKNVAIRIATARPRGNSLTGFTTKELHELQSDLQDKAAWAVLSASVKGGKVFYPEQKVPIKETRVIALAENDFPEIEFFDKAVVLNTPAGESVRQRQAIQAECDAENAELKKQELLEKRKKQEERKQKKMDEEMAWINALGRRNPRDQNNSIPASSIGGLIYLPHMATVCNGLKELGCKFNFSSTAEGKIENITTPDGITRNVYTTFDLEDLLNELRADQ